MELLNVHESEIQAISENLEEADLKPKIRKIDRINKLLAHRPWAIKRHHIKVSNTYIWRSLEPLEVQIRGAAELKAAVEKSHFL